MVDYKPRTYTGQMGYTPKTKPDPRIQLYKPQNPVKDITEPARTYDTNPPKYVEAKEYDKVKTYNSYAEYVPPWTRGKEKVKREPPPPKPKPDRKPVKKAKPKPKVEPILSPVQEQEAVATVPPLPVLIQNGVSLPATGSIIRTMRLFEV